MIRTLHPFYFAASAILLGTSVLCAADPGPQAAQGELKSDAYTWKNVTVGAGGFMPGIVFSRVEKGLAYLRSDMGGFYRWDEAKKTWLPLNDAIAESSYMGGESVAPDPVDANVVYVAAGMYRNDPSAMMRSRDRGQTWQIFPVPFRMGGNEDGRGVGERLAVDPNDTHVLYFGSRHDGLMRSDDHAETWKRVESFPVRGRGLPARGQPTNTGLSFVVFDPRGGTKGAATKTIFVGSADPGPEHLFRSDDAGATWKPVTGGPGADMLPLKAELDDDGRLYLTYGDGAGPNGVKKGAVFALDTNTGEWTDITPEKGPNRAAGGYCGLSIDRQQKGTLAVTTMNRWSPGDTVWRTTDGGRTWHDIAARSERDVSASPFLQWGLPKPRLGWWMAALAIDPFDSDHAVYATGATVFATNDFSKVSDDAATHWYPWIKGIEQTAIITLCSPSDGPHLVSGFGDIGGFAHRDLDQSPPQGMFANPRFVTTSTIDYAGRAPNVIVRAGTASEKEAVLALSNDSGETWQPLTLPETGGGVATTQPRARRTVPPITVSADGKHILVSTRTPMITADAGKTWSAVKGLPDGCRPVADRVDANTFYSVDFDNAELYVSSDGGETFRPLPSQGLPRDVKADRPNWNGAPHPLSATFAKAGDLWYLGKAGLFHSTDAGKTFAAVPSDVKVEMLSFGKAPAGREEPALFAVGTKGDVRGVWRSDDSGVTWLRLNDAGHEWGRRFRCITGDPRLFGRVYIGTDGRGVFYGEPAAGR